MDFIVEIKNKASGIDRKFQAFAPSRERAEQWGSKQAEALNLDIGKTRIVVTPVVVPAPAAELPKEDPKKQAHQEAHDKDQKATRRRRRAPREENHEKNG